MRGVIDTHYSSFSRRMVIAWTYVLTILFGVSLSIATAHLCKELKATSDNKVVDVKVPPGRTQSHLSPIDDSEVRQLATPLHFEPTMNHSNSITKIFFELCPVVCQFK